MGEIFNIMKTMDIFAQPVQLMTTQGDFKLKKNEKKKRQTKYGTICGFIMTAGMACFGLAYITILFQKMYT